MKDESGRIFVYEKNPLIEVICQLRFPTILSIESAPPAAFQEKIRDRFPRYHSQENKLPTASGESKTTTSYNFVTEAGDYRLSLANSFIAISTMRYAGWDQFGKMFYDPLKEFVEIYRPAYFERVGLRYVNGISRKRLNLDEHRWNDLLEPQYLGVLDNAELEEGNVSKCAVDVEMKLDEQAHLKLHAGPGRIQRTVRTPNGMKTLQDNDVSFIFDQDLFTGGNIKYADIAETLNHLHYHADSIFSDAITDLLHEAMEPTVI